MELKDRNTVARFIEKQMDYNHECSREKGEQTHYGWQELRDLMDFIYNSKPKHKEQELNN